MRPPEPREPGENRGEGCRRERRRGQPVKRRGPLIVDTRMRENCCSCDACELLAQLLLQERKLLKRGVDLGIDQDEILLLGVEGVLELAAVTRTEPFFGFETLHRELFYNPLSLAIDTL